MNIIFIWTAVFVSHYASWVWNISSIIWSLEKISYSLETFCFSKTNFFDKRHNFPALTAELVYGIKMSLRCFSLKIARTDDYSRGILWPSLACCPNTPTRSCFKANKTQLHMLSFSVTALVMDSYLLAVFSRIKWPATTNQSEVMQGEYSNRLPETSYTPGAATLRGSGSCNVLITDDSAALCLSFTRGSRWLLRQTKARCCMSNVQQGWKVRLNLYYYYSFSPSQNQSVLKKA